MNMSRKALNQWKVPIYSYNQGTAFMSNVIVEN